MRDNIVIQFKFLNSNPEEADADLPCVHRLGGYNEPEIEIKILGSPNVHGEGLRVGA